MINLFTLGLAAMLAFSSPAIAQSLIIPHGQGETRIEGQPQSVVVTDWAAFDNLTALGVKVAGVPGSNVPGHLADKVSADMVKVGSLQEPDIEGIAALSPDLVIVAGRSRTAYPTLSRIAPTLDVSVDNAALIDSVKANLTTFGKIFGKSDRAAELIVALDAKVEEARAAAAGKGAGLVIITNGNRIGIYGPESRVSWIYKELNIPSVFDNVDDRDHGGDAITFEYLLQTNPDWLFVVDRDAGVGNDGSARQLLDNELIHQTNFWKNDRVIYLDPQASYVTMHGYDALIVLLDQVIAGYSAQ
ncbi:siderophore ABC transporter substrate-binding protein [Aquamicrobium ahrensii]|uniref:Iron complex transport system substrate-binding protein n=1 Tax=Aquamicrobium ahrensii TaxID=469551 RepID=A0ABV2KT79_9HYPH